MRFVILVSGLVVGCSAKDEGGSGVLGARSADSGDAEGDDGTDASGPNEPPTSASISLLPVAPTTMDDLVVTIDVPATDPDGDDLEYIYTWYRDGDARDDISTDTAGALFTRRGEVWEVSVQATDGRELGEEVSVEVVIENSLPSVSEIRIDPEEVYEATEVTCVVGETDDADHDPIQAQVRWMVDGSQLNYYKL